jgi:DNA polymerase-3 subunit delta'
MAFSDVQGQPRAVHALRAALRENALHHAWLFTGPSGVGKELTALSLAQALVCAQAPREGCGKCAACLRVSRFHHPDVLWLMAEDEAVRRKLAARSDFDHVPSREIRVEQVRRLQERLALRPLECSHKVVLLLPAEAMNPQAQNAFLKTLEEPPPETVLVLITAAPDRLLPTLRSRCARLGFGPLPHALVKEQIQARRELSPEVAEAVAALADGSLERALALDAEHLADRRGLSVWVRDVAVARAGGSSLFHPELRPLAEAVAARLDDDALHRRFRLLDEAGVAIRQRNAAPRLQLERMLLEMQR